MAVNFWKCNLFKITQIRSSLILNALRETTSILKKMFNFQTRQKHILVCTNLHSLQVSVCYQKNLNAKCIVVMWFR